MRGLLAGWRGLGRFWAAVLLVLGASSGVLQILGGPPEALSVSPRSESRPSLPVPSVVHPDPTLDKPPIKAAAMVRRPGRSLPGPTADPDPAMLEPMAGSETAKLPRIAVDGRSPMNAYAAGFDPSSLRPRVGLLIAGIGMSEAESLDAIKNLPGGVTLAISAYAGDIGHLLDVARMSEHEYLLSIPMEPQGYPVNDPDDRFALMTGLPVADNLARLRGILARFTGYVGVTDTFGQMHGERLAGAPDQLDSVLREAAHRGLLFIDARTGHSAQAHAWTRSADLIIDDDPVDAAILDQRLDTLTRLALDRGSALGIVSVPRPVTLARVAAWTNRLASQGVALAPVSALVLPPTDAEQEPEK